MKVNGSPCKTEGSTTDICAECDTDYVQLLYSSTKTICAKVSAGVCTIDSADYPTEATAQTDDSIVYTYYSGTSGSNPYCFNCQEYFTRSGTALCGACTQTAVESSYYSQSVYSQTQGCADCQEDEYKQQSVEVLSHVNLKMRDCLISSSQTAACTYTQFYDTSSSTCKECTTLWPNCASCTSSACLTCPNGFYYHSSAYDPATNSNKAMCVFGVCPAGYCRNPTTNQCVLLTSTLSNCKICSYIDVSGTQTQSCDICSAGYLPEQLVNPGAMTCKILDTSVSTTLRYYIKSGAPTLESSFTYNFQTQTGLAPASAFYFIQEALTAAHTSVLTTYTSYTEVYIYLGTGNHFFFQCDGDESTTTYTDDTYQDLVQYCSDTVSYYKLLKQYPQHDNVKIIVQPLFCNLASTLGYSSDTDFTNMCVSSGQKAMVYVNHAQAQFNITGVATFSDIKFSGINSFAVPSTSTHDLTVWPVLFCQQAVEPSGSDVALRLNKQSSNDANYFSFSCGDQWHTAPAKIDQTKTNQRCLLNNNAAFYPQQESTLACPGEPSHSNFFYQTSQTGVYSKRRHSLFNLYAFPDYQSTYKQPPQITISNCEFEYMLGNYESLINVENNNLQKHSVTTTTTLTSGTVITDTKTFYTLNAADKGAKITINSSTFKHSRFCKGMITYRKAWNITVGKASFTNYNQLFSLSGNKDYSKSGIFINGITVTNLNALTKINALAIYGGVQPMRALSSTSQIETIMYPAFIHKGIFLNVEDFGGLIEIAESTFQKNFHFIPEAVMKIHSSQDSHSVDQFKDSFTTQEYKLAMCDTINKQDLYFFHRGLKPGDNIDNLYDLFERISLMYISRNRYMMLFRGNRFIRNIGTFGGAISINSPDWKRGSTNKPYFAAFDNIYENNMAYFSGNAIYFRNTQKTSKVLEICAGGHIESSLFYNNIGLKAHDGGAVSAVCQYLTNSEHDDYSATSSINSLFSPVDILSEVYEPLQATIDTSYNFNVLAFRFTIELSNFTENYSGQKGSAVYIKQMSKIRINSCRFENNGPVYSLTEQQSSPYYTYLSNRAITFNDPTDTCFDEFNFMNECDSDDTYIDWPEIQGALHIQFCEDTLCMNENNYQVLRLLNSDFINNDAGPILDTYQDNENMASSLFIRGGFSNQISRTKFRDHKGNYDFYASIRSPRIGKHYPTIYFQYSQSPMIRVKTYPGVIPETTLNFTTQFYACTFKNNKHINILGLPSGLMYPGSLITYQSNYFKGKYMQPILDVSSSTIKDNKFLGNDTSLFYISNGQLIFNDNTVYGSGYLQSSFSITKSKSADVNIYFLYDSYTFYQYQMYGVINLNGKEVLPSGTTHQIFRNSFTFCVSYQGAVAAINVDNQFVYFQSNTYLNNFAIKGAAIQASANLARSTIRFNSENFNNQFSSQKGALVFEPTATDLLSFWVQSSNFKNCWASQGGAIHATSIAAGIVSNSNFYDDLFVKVKITGIVKQFSKSQWALSEFIELTIMTQLVDGVIKKGGSVYLENGQNTRAVTFSFITIKAVTDTYLSYSELIDCAFTSLQAIQASAVMIGGGIQVRIRNTATGGNKQFYNCSHINNGAIYVKDGGILLGENLNLNTNTASLKGAVLGAENGKITFNNCTIRSNRANDKGIIYLVTDSFFTCNQCSFISNYANDSSAIFALNNLEGMVNITNSQFVSNGHIQNLMNLIYSQALISNTLFIDNIARVVNNGITMIGSTLSAKNITITYSNQNFLANIGTAIDAGFFSLSFQSTIIVNASLIENVRGSSASVLYASGSSSAIFDGQTTIRNCTSVAGNVLHFTLANVVRILNTNFNSNSQSDIYIQKGDAFVLNCTFINTYSNSIKAEQANLTVSNSTFKDASNNQINGKGIYCKCNTLIVDNCIFSNLTGLQGGGIYLTSYTNTTNYNVRFSKFNNNQAMHGGAIKVADAVSLVILSNEFNGNQAKLIDPPTSSSQYLTQKGMGGAVNLECFNQDLYLFRNCSIYLQQTNVFRFNTATHDGGALLWLSNRYTDDGSNTFSNNSAPYGDNIGSYPKNFIVEFINNNDYFNPYNSTYNVPKRQLLALSDKNRLLQVNNSSTSNITSNTTQNTTSNSNTTQANIKFPDIVSGTPFSFVVYIIDQDGLLYKTDSNSTAFIITKDNLVIKNGETTALKGIYNFSSATILMDPGTNALTQIYINQQSLQQIPFFQKPYIIQVKARRCQLGEAYTSDKRCVQCSNLEYLFVAPQKETPCKICPKEAQCYGRNLVGPAPGYWRSSNESENFLACYYSAACKGGDYNNPQGECSPGYKGVLCGDCQAGYRKIGTYQCQECPSTAALAIGLILQIVACVIIMVLIVKITLYCSDKPKSQQSVYFRIITDHFQIMAIIFYIDYKWTAQLDSIQEGQAYISELITYMFNFECYWAKDDPNVTSKSFTAKLAFYTMLPITLSVIIIVTWLIYGKFLKKSLHGIKERIISTVVIMLFIVHAPICYVLLQTFNCVLVEGVNRLQQDLGSICFQGNHMVLILTLAGPGLVIWGLGIPLVFLALLLKNKKTIAQIDHILSLSKADQYSITQAKVKYGFLFIGFKTNSYYWEIIQMFKKMLLIMTIVLLSVVSSDTQVLVALMLIIFTMILQVRFEPFSSIRINRMEHYSVQVQTLTLYIGMFFVTGSKYTYMENEGAKHFFLILIIASNFGFMVYWLNAVRIEILMLALTRNRKLFRILSCNLINADRFRKSYQTDADVADMYLEKAAESSQQNGSDGSVRGSESDHPRKGGKKVDDDFSNVLVKRSSADEGSESPSASSESEAGSNKKRRRGHINDSAEIQSDGTGKGNNSADPEDVKLDFPMRMMKRIQAREELQFASSDRSILMRKGAAGGNNGPGQPMGREGQSFRKVYPTDNNDFER